MAQSLLLLICQISLCHFSAFELGQNIELSGRLICSPLKLPVSRLSNAASFVNLSHRTKIRYKPLRCPPPMARPTMGLALAVFLVRSDEDSCDWQTASSLAVAGGWAGGAGGGGGRGGLDAGAQSSGLQHCRLHHRSQPSADHGTD